MKAREVVKALKAEGFAEAGGKGGHLKLRHRDGRWTIVPMHPGDIPFPTLKAIEKQTRVRLT